jgi:hypothetical protein
MIPVLISAPPALAAQPVPNHSALVPEVPRVDTPRVDSGEILDIEVAGNRVYLAGTFTSIRDANGTSVAQRYLAAYDMNTGLLDMNFRPTIDRSVAAVEASPDGSALYIAGQFNNISGVARRKIARIDPARGTVVTSFRANANSRTSAIAVSSTTVYVGGFFSRVNGVSRGRLVALDPTTGAVDPLNLPITEGIGSGGVLKVMQLQLTTDDRTLLVVHTGRRVAGQSRTGVALVDTATRSLRPWQTNLFDDNLARVGGVLRVANGDISPDNSYFVLVSGSGGDRPPINDTAMAFPVAGGAGVEPLWISRHFDSVYSVAISEVAVYVGGHFRWQESATATQPWPGDADTAYGWGSGLGAAVFGDEVVRRDTIGALDPATGTSLDWNPGANPFEGVKALELHPRGLLIGQDGTVIGGRTIGRHGFFDFTRVPPPGPAETTITDPFEGGTVGAGIPTLLRGEATALSQVSRVQLELRNTATGRYLQDDLVSWGSYNAFNATLDQLDATETGWSHEVTLPDGPFRLYARTFAEDGTRDSSKASAKFEAQLLDDAPPETRISTPPGGLLNTPTFMLGGTATDDSGVLRLSVYVKNTDTRAYLQDDGTVAAGYNSLEVIPDNPGDPSVTWSTEITVPEGQWEVNASAVDDAGQSDPRGAARTFSVSATNTAPTVAITEPLSPATVTPGTRLTIRGTAADNAAVRRVQISLQNSQTREGIAIDGTWGIPGWYTVTPLNLNSSSVTWSLTTPPLPAGSYSVQVLATDNFDVTTPSAGRARLTLTSAVPGDAPPDTALDFAATTQDVDDLRLTLAGTATDNLGVAGVRLIVRDTSTGRYVTNTAGATSSAFTMLPATLNSPGATSTRFSITVNLQSPGNYSVTAMALDSAGQWDTSTTGATARYLIFPGDTDPYLNLDSPNTGATLTNFISIGGRAYDDVAVSRVQVQVRNIGTGAYLQSTGTLSTASAAWLSAFVTNPGGTGSNYNYTTPVLPAGNYLVSARAVDSVGQVQAVPNTATVTVVG